MDLYMEKLCGNLLLEVKNSMGNEWITEAQCLTRILDDPHLLALMAACDEITYAREQCNSRPITSEHDYYISMSNFSSDVLETVGGDTLDDENGIANQVKFVQIIKGAEPLGATIKFDDESGAILVTRIMHGGAAHRSGLMAVGDIICEVNGVWLYGKPQVEVVHFLERECRRSFINFKLVAGGERNYADPDQLIIVRAHFDYNPATDPEHPCCEAGLLFKRGDVIQIVEREDENWWQARHAEDDQARAALIPSVELRTKRVLSLYQHSSQALKTLIVPINQSSQENCKTLFNKSQRKNSLLKTMFLATKHKKSSVRKAAYFISETTQREAVATYEQVALMEPSPNLYRPIVFIGAARIGKTKILKRMLELNSELYKQPLAHTSRESCGFDVDGGDYYFVSKEWMCREIAGGRFLEYREHRGHLYGIHENTVIDLISSGIIALMNLQPQSLKHVRSCAYIRPYVIFIRPSNSLSNSNNSTNTDVGSKRVSKRQPRQFNNCEDNYVKLFVETHKIDFLYGQYFDLCLVNENFEETVKEVFDAVQMLKKKPQWVPAHWLTEIE